MLAAAKWSVAHAMHSSAALRAGRLAAWPALLALISSRALPCPCHLSVRCTLQNMQLNMLCSMPSALAQEEWSKAAHALAGIDLDSGMRLLDAGDSACMNHALLSVSQPRGCMPAMHVFPGCAVWASVTACK